MGYIKKSFFPYFHHSLFYFLVGKMHEADCFCSWCIPPCRLNFEYTSCWCMMLPGEDDFVSHCCDAEECRQGFKRMVAWVRVNHVGVAYCPCQICLMLMAIEDEMYIAYCDYDLSLCELFEID